jgi:dTDP-4-amino-4,6-dideoxygalactose transaminase
VSSARLPSGKGSPIRLSAPTFDRAELDRCAQALAGQVSGNGPFCQRVERRLEELLPGTSVLLTTSCTHALELALLALGIGPGAEVICPSFTFVSTANAILRVGARPVFADIEPETLGLDPGDVARRLGPRSAAMIPVHYAGVSADMDGLLRLARERNLRVVEDAAHGLDARYRGAPLGTLGDAGCFSFHETKNITCGEGGALAVRDPEVARRAEVIREKGTNRASFMRGEAQKYTWMAEGSSYVLSDLLAAVLDAQLDKLPRLQQRRREVATRYREGLAHWAARNGARLPVVPPDREGNEHIFYVLLPDEDARSRCLDRLRADGIMAAFHYLPLHRSPFGGQLGQGDLELPVTERVAATLLRLPLHANLTDGDVDRVIDGVQRALA